MAALKVVELDEDIEVGLDLLDRLVPFLPALDAEVLVEQRAVHALDEAVGARRADLRGPVLDVVERQQQLVRVVLGASGELAPVVAEYGFNCHAEGIVERQYSIMEQVGGGDRHLRGVDLGERQGTEGVDDDLNVDLADALERAPVERVLIEQFSGRRGLDMAHAELRRVALQQPDLFLGQDVGLLPGLGLEAQQALVARLQIMAEPDAAHAGRADVDALEAELVGDTLGTVGGLFEAQVEDALLDGLGDPVRMRVPGAAALLDEGGHAADLERLLDLVEGVAVVAHDLAGLRDVAQFFGQLQQRQLTLGTL